MPDGDLLKDADEVDAEESLLMSADTLRGDVRDVILSLIRGQKKPFQQLSELEQADVISTADKAAKHLCRQAVKLIAAGGRTAVQAHIEAITAKDGLKITLKASRNDVHRFALLDQVGEAVEIVLISTDELDGEQNPAHAEPDQGRLPLAGEKPVFDDTDHGADGGVELFPSEDGE